MTNPTRTPHPQVDEALDEERVAAARLYVQQLRAFHIHAAVFAGTMIVMFVVNLLTNGAAGIGGAWSAWWSIWAFVGWGLGIATHGLVVRLNRPAASSTWEQQQIDKVLAR